MIQAIAGPAAQVSTEFLPPQSDEFWHSLGIFPGALPEKGDLADLATAAQKELKAVGRKNLLALIEEAGIARPESDDAGSLALHLFLRSDALTLVCLRDFVKSRDECIRAAYEATIPERKRKGIEASLRDIAPGAEEPLRPLTRLLFLFQHDPDSLIEASFIQLWQGVPTAFELEAAEPLPARFQQIIEGKRDEFTRAISGAWSNRAVRPFKVHRLRDGTAVFVFAREYAPRIARDFRSTFNVHRKSGFVIFGISKDRKHVYIKCGNSQIADAIRLMLDHLFSAKLRVLNNVPFRDYDPNRVKANLCGGYSSAAGVEIVAATLRRTSLHSRGKLSLARPTTVPSIRDDLQQLVSSSLLELHSLDDIEELGITYRERTAKVEFEPQPDGAIRLQLDDTGWNLAARGELEEAFLTAFGVPLNRLVDPQRMALGSVGIIAHLLNVQTPDEIRDYQQEQYKLLTEAELLTEDTRQAKVCRNPLCDAKAPVFNLSAEVCRNRNCHKPLQPATVIEVTRNNSGIVKFTRESFDDLTGWHLSDAQSFENQEHFLLKDTSKEAEEDIAVLFKDRLSTAAKELFGRTGLPLIVVSPRTDERYVFVEDGIGHVSLSYLFSARQSDDDWKDCGTRCKALVRMLLAQHRDRIHRAAATSFQRIIQGARQLGHTFETDVSNVLRAIFPYTFQFGRKGKVEPDGYVSVVVVGADGDRSLDSVQAWNWTFDAKFSDKKNGYDLGQDERRKMVEYIDKVRSSRRFLGKGRLNGHAILFNKLSEKLMQDAADHVFGSEGVKAKNRDVKLMFVNQSFVTRLYERVNAKDQDVQRRMPLLGECFREVVEQADGKQYVMLDAPEADKIIEKMLEAPEVEAAMREQEVARGLD